MSEYLIQDSTLTDIADAIRAKDGTTASMTASEMASKIGAIKGGFPNGTEWTQSDLTTVACSGVHYGNGIWVAGTDNGLYYSTTGKSWTQSNVTSGTCYGICYANGLWVASNNTVSNKVCYSTDGITWTGISDYNHANMTGILYVDGLWVSYSTNNGAYYSTTGKSWSTSLSIATRYIYYGNGIWVAGTYNGLYYSTTGKSWTQSNVTSGDFNKVYYANGMWLAACSSGIYYSTTGKSWAQSNIDTNSSSCFIGYGNGLWVVANGYMFCYYSTDGKTWSDASGDTGGFTCGFYASGIWVIGSATKGMFYSTTGKSWTQSNTSNIYCRSFCNGNGIWVAATDNGMYYSVTWEP